MIINKITKAIGLASLLFGASQTAYAAKPDIPQDGERLFILGQDQLSIQDYMADADLPRPNGFTSYISLTRGATETVTGYCFKGLDGLKNLDDYNSNSANGCPDSERRNQWGSGVQNTQWIIDTYKPEHVAIGMFCPGNDQAAGFANGSHDDLLVELADFFKENAETKFFLRTCYEFNGDAHGLSFDAFRTIYKHVHNTIQGQGVDNVAYVWQSDAFHGTGRATNAIGNNEQGYWPGKQYVDWVGVSQFASDVNEEALIAEAEGLPLFIAEVTPHGDLGTQYDFQIPFGTSQQLAQGTSNPVTTVNNLDWFNQKNAEIMRTSTKAWHYINADWTAQPQWEGAVDQAGANYFKYTDSRVQESAEIKQYFTDLVSEENGFILAADNVVVAPEACTGSDEPIATAKVKRHESEAGAEDGAIKFTFAGDGGDTRTKIKFSLDGGESFVGKAKDKKGKYLLENVAPGTHNLATAWSDGSCLTQIGTVTVKKGSGVIIVDPNSPVVTAEGGEGSITFTFEDNVDQTRIRFSTDGGETYLPKVKDNLGSYTISDLPEGEYTPAASWGNGDNPVILEPVTVTSGNVVIDECVGDDAPSATAIATAETAPEANDGTVTFSFPGDNGGERTKIKFSIDGGQTFSTKVKDSAGSFTFSNVEPGNYDLVSAWGDGSCELDIANVTVDAADPIDQVIKEVEYEAENASLSGIQTGTYNDGAASGGQGVAYISEETARVAFSNMNAGEKITLRYASENSGTITVDVDGVDYSVSFGSTGAWTGSYQTVSVDADIQDGATITVEFNAGDAALNLDYIIVDEFDGPYIPNPAITLEAPTQINEGSDWVINPVVKDWDIQQGGQHFHLILDGEDLGPQFSAAPIVLSDLSIGAHTAVAKLANADHSFTGVEGAVSVEVVDVVASTVAVGSSEELGNFLVAGAEHPTAPNMTLYTFDPDQEGQPSVCNEGCIGNWPALIVESADDIVAPSGVTGLGVQARNNGDLQVTLNGEPLYFFAGDSVEGDTNGHTQGDVWWVADIPTPEFADNTWEKSVVPACSDIYSGGAVPNIGYHIYTEGNNVVFKAGNQLASNVWGNGIRTVFFRNDSNGFLKHLGTVEGTRNGNESTMSIPADWMTGNSVFYVSYQRKFAPQEPEIGDKLEYQDSALYGLNKGCHDGVYNAQPEDFAGWIRFQHPQGFFNDHNVFNERIDPANNSVGHFKNLPRFTAKVVQDEPGKDLLIQIDLTYEAYSTMSATDDITWAAIEGSEPRAGGGSPRQQVSLACEKLDAAYNSAMCNLGQHFGYGQNIDWELRVIPTGSAGSNLYSQMLFYVKGHGWVRESVDPRALLGGYASIDAFGANVYERASAFMQHNHTADLKVARDFVEQHEDFRVNIGTDLQPGFKTCENCHVNDGRSQVAFDVPNVGTLIAPPLIGLGLLEKVEFPGKAGFGWRGNKPTVEAAVRSALDVDFGVSNPDETMVDRLTNYSQFVAVPQRDKSELFEPEVIAGEALFNGKMECSACHTETQITNDGDVIRPYSDLLTHDMGDGVFRTAPLWGIGRTAQVAAFSMNMPVAAGGPNASHDKNQREFVAEDEMSVLFMHDGRAKGLDAAVRAHNGEGSAARAAYETASQTERDQLLRFLRSL